MSDLKINEVVNLIKNAGGKIVGRTRLQKIAYLLFATGLDENFRFAYKHYGPFSEQLASSAKIGALLGSLVEQQSQTTWGSTYSIYSLNDLQENNSKDPRHLLASIAADAESIELELAATAVFLFHEGYRNPWDETAQRKPEKSTEVRLKNAKELLKRLSAIDVPKSLPNVLMQ